MAHAYRRTSFHVRRGSMRARSCPRAGWLRASPDSRFSRTRRSWARTPLRTNPAYTRTASSRAAIPTKSCALEDIGWNANKLVLGKHSGRNAFRTRLTELGVVIDSEEALNAAFKRFKDLADKKHEIFDEDLQALISQTADEVVAEQYRLVALTAHSETGEEPFASIVISQGGREVKTEAHGSGPVDASFKAIEAVARSGAELLLYSVNSITTGTDAQGEVTVRLSKGERIVNGQGADTDIVVASAKAYIDALNKLHSTAERVNPQV